MTTDLDRLRADLREHAEHIVVTLLGDPMQRSRGELRYGRTGSLAVVVGGAKAGTWFDFETHEGGDVLALIEREHRCGFPRGIEIASEMLRRTYDENRPARCSTAHPDDRERQRWCTETVKRLWREAIHIEGTPGARYFYKRGIDITLLPEFGGLRWHPRCLWRDGQTGCVLARFTDPVTGELRGLWRRPISGEMARALGPMKDSVIRLWSDEAVTTHLCIAEGIETAAAASQIAYRGTLLQPVWATGCAGNMASLPVLAGIEALTILVDHDKINPKTGTRPGEEAARECAERWARAGRDVTLLTPTREGADFNDVVLTG